MISFFGPAQASNVTAATQIKAARGVLFGVFINPTGAVTPTVTVYDNASASSGNKLVNAKIESAKPLFIWFGDAGVNATNGIRVDSTSFTTLDVTVYYA